jgi:hypothetical protein
VARRGPPPGGCPAGSASCGLLVAAGMGGCPFQTRDFRPAPSKLQAALLEAGAGAGDSQLSQKPGSRSRAVSAQKRPQKAKGRAARWMLHGGARGGSGGGVGGVLPRISRMPRGPGALGAGAGCHRMSWDLVLWA